MSPKRDLTTAEVAQHHGISARRVLDIARSRGIEPVQRVGAAWLWRAKDLERFARRPAGRPRKEKS